MDVFGLGLTIFLVVVVYAVYLRIAIKSFRRLSGIDDFFIYNGRLREASVFSATYAAEMSLATVFIAFMTLAPLMGLSLIWSIGTFVTGQLALWAIIPHIKRRVSHGETLQTFLGDTFSSSKLRVVASLASVLGFIGLFSTEIVVGAKLFSGLVSSPAGYWSILTFVTFLVIFYTTLGGFKSVVVTDRVQTAGTIFAVGVLVLTAFLVGYNKDGHLIEPSLLSNVQLPWLLIANFAIINILYPLCDMAAWQRVAAARSIQVARRGFGFSVFMFLISWSAILFAALALSENATRDSAGGIAFSLGALSQLGLWQALVTSVAFAALAAAMLSTGDTFLIAASQSLSMDVRFPLFFDERRRTNPEWLNQLPDGKDDFSFREEKYAGIRSSEILAWSRMSIFAMAIVGVALSSMLSHWGFQVADFVFVVYGSTVALFPAIAAAFLATNTDRRASLSVAAIISTVAGLIAGWLYGIGAVTGDEKITQILAQWVPLPGGTSTYNSPTVAVVVSGALFILIGVPSYWLRGRAS